MSLLGISGLLRLVRILRSGRRQICIRNHWKRSSRMSHRRGPGSNGKLLLLWLLWLARLTGRGHASLKSRRTMLRYLELTTCSGRSSLRRAALLIRRHVCLVRVYGGRRGCGSLLRWAGLEGLDL